MLASGFKIWGEVNEDGVGVGDDVGVADVGSDSIGSVESTREVSVSPVVEIPGLFAFPINLQDTRQSNNGMTANVLYFISLLLILKLWTRILSE